LGDTIKAMYITVEGMTNAGITTVAEKLSIEDMQQQQERAMERQATQGI
jgi:deoxyadenosine/deoxycytidine kinase